MKLNRFESAAVLLIAAVLLFLLFGTLALSGSFPFSSGPTVPDVVRLLTLTVPPPAPHLTRTPCPECPPAGPTPTEVPPYPPPYPLPVQPPGD